MRSLLAILAFSSMLAFVGAECPNACSGHGTCEQFDNCACFDNWVGGDCSQRVCPFGLAFVDTPRGDLNHDGEVSYSSVPIQSSNWRDVVGVNEIWQGSLDGEAHYYAECSGKGSCNRGDGTCSCFDGYTGASCQRTTCPNDCSGHGLCYTLREIAEGGPTVDQQPTGFKRGRNFRVEKFDFGEEFHDGISTAFNYEFWDADKNQACVCETGFFGVDCSMRECPKGADPLTNEDKFCGNTDCVVETQLIAIDNAASGAMIIEWLDNINHGNSLTGSRLVSEVINIASTDNAAAIKAKLQAALESFPNGALYHTTVDTFESNGNDFVFSVQFKRGDASINGRPNPLVAYQVLLNQEVRAINDAQVPAAEAGFKVESYFVRNGVCKTGQLFRKGDRTAILAGTFDCSNDIGDLVEGNTENLRCSNRGMCDFSTGTCQCFAGYTKENCQQQSALAQ
eukprot:gb/GECG01006341.1/.p1 GENE.gb/GECG01006341.1/~~gb/GECG01006341.1/.p1  ORF type:complete len:453 (+),score=45.96 gb/GECG01006341.1/:1-1359(+)